MKWLLRTLVAATLLSGVAYWQGSWPFLDTRLLEREIEASVAEWAAEAGAGDSEVDASCPRRRLSLPGSTFLCEVGDDHDTGMVRVDVLNWRGDVEWEAR